MKTKICFFIIFSLIFSTISPIFTFASTVEANIESKEVNEYDTAEVEIALEELGLKNVEVKEEDNVRSISYLNKDGSEYSATYNLENEEFTFNSSNSSLDSTEEIEIANAATEIVGDKNTLEGSESLDDGPINVVPREGSSWTYQGTRYGTSRDRDALIAAVATLIVLSLPAGSTKIHKVKAVFGAIMVYLGRTYDTTYYKTVIYTKHDAYTLRTRVEYYAYSNSARTKLKTSDVRYHTVQKVDLR